MKNYLLLTAVIITSSIAAFGQDSIAPAAAPAAPAIKESKAAKEATFPREKFDPSRNARADLDSALKAAAKSGRNIVLDIGGEWCGWCVYMDKFFYQNTDLAKMRDDNFVWVKVNFSPENENQEFLSAYPERAGYPHLFVLDAAGKLLKSQDTSELEEGKGYNHDRFAEFLKQWAPENTKDLPKQAGAAPAAKAN